MSFNDLTKRCKAADAVHETLKVVGADFSTGVPCGVLRHFINNAMRDKDVKHVISQNEPEAVGVATGAYLGSKRPFLYMQNSGFLKSVNEYGTLLIPYQIPILNIVTYRGCPGEDAQQHLVNGRITLPVLEALGIPYDDLKEGTAAQQTANILRAIEERKQPGVLLVRRGWAPSTEREVREPIEKADLHANQTQVHNLLSNGTMSREKALDAIVGSTSNEDALLSTTGLMSRSLYERHDSPNQYYNTGSFGLVSSIGLGFALSKPDVRTIVVDGDASLLTNFGTLVSIAAEQPANLVHIVVDNGAYGSCSEECTCSSGVVKRSMLAHAGYKNIMFVNTAPMLGMALDYSQNLEGPTLIHAKTVLGGRRDFKRPPDLAYIAQRFKEFFS